VLRLLKRDNSLAPCQEHLIPLDDYYDLVGLKPLLAREESYDKAAAALASVASGQRGDSMVRAPDTRPEPGSSARAALVQKRAAE
jgi:hypothetical protein